ncbi:MAG TPA: uracil-DNA glycosylase [Patescibacteria group bacterium]|nr:uracil-DNA glycosylase [Patescibacteria group bacterium]
MNKALELQKIYKAMEDDKSLPLITKPKDIIPGEGNPNAEVIFIGEAGGYHESVQRKPFVGNAGMLLNQLLFSIKLPREDVYITNMVKTRPPNNRDPLPEELKAFEEYLDREIDIISPKVIVTLGRFSMAKFFPGVFISSVHGKPKELLWKAKSITVIPMYHPAAGLRSLDVKEKLKEDFLMLPGILEKTKHQETGNIKREEVEQIKLL